MEPITFEELSNQLNIYFHGRMDANAASAAGAELDRALSVSSLQNVILDFSDLEYISSAGLRLILKVRKQRPKARVIGVSAEVYDVLEMTGFSEMLPIEKAYRSVSIEGCKMIAKGANGAVYRLDQDTILKVSLNKDALPSIHREQDLARKAFILGVPTAISYDVVKVGDTYGSVFELLDCEPLSALLSADPGNYERYAGIFVDLLKTIHSVEGDPTDTPSEKEEVLGWVAFLKDYLPAGTWTKLHSLVDAVPESCHLLHGDYHARNVMVQNGEPLLIDMDTLCHGNPVFEWASTFNAYKGFSMIDEDVIRNFHGISRETGAKFFEKSLSLYFNTEDREKLRNYEDRAALIGYSRLLRRSIRKEDQSLEKTKFSQEFFRKEICRLAESLSDLAF